MRAPREEASKEGRMTATIHPIEGQSHGSIGDGDH
jgi:hypothetical protein